MRLVIGACAGVVLVWSHDALAQKGVACASDIRVFCAHLQSGHGAMQRCLQEYLGDLSSACRAHLQRGLERARTPRSREHAGTGKMKQANQ